MSSDNDWFNRDLKRPETIDTYRTATHRTRDYQRQHWIPAVLVGLLALGMLIVAIGGRDALPPAAEANSSSTPATGTTTPHGPSLHIHAHNSPEDDGPTYYRYTAPQLVTRSAPLTYYQCVRNGQKILSDAPCSVSAAARTLDTSQLNHFSAPPPVRRQASSFAPENNETAPEPRAAPLQAAAGETQCHYLEKHIANIDARMRTGYGSQEGEYLHEQRREATDAYHKAHCTKF